MRQSLLIARQDLHSLDEQAREEQKLTEDMARLREQKEHQKATDTMQLKTILVELDEEKSKTRKLESVNSDLGDKMKELKSKLQVLTTQNQDLEIGDTFMKNEIKMLKTLNDERSIEIQQLQEMVNELQSRTKDKLNESSINMSFNMPENLGDVLATDFQSKVNELEELTEQLTNDNAELVKQGEERKMAIENLENKVQDKEAMEDQVKQLEHHNAELVEQRESLKEASEKFHSEVEMKENEYLKQLEEKDSMKEILESKVYEVEQLSAQATDFHSKVKELQELTEQLKNHNVQLVEQGEERTKAIETLEKKAEGKVAMENQVKQLEHHNAELVEQRESLKEATVKFQSKLEVRENEYLKEVKEKDSIKEILESKVKEMKQLSAQATGLQSKVNKLEELTEQLKNYNAELVEQGKERKTAIETLEKKAEGKVAMEDQVKQLKHHNAELVEQSESLKVAADKFQSKLEMRENEYLKEVKEKDSIKEILQSKVNEMKQLSAQATNFQSKVNELEELTEQLKNHNAELVQQGEERKMAFENLENKVQNKEAIEDQVKQLEHHNAELVEQRESLKVALDNYQSELETRENDYLKQLKEKESIKESLKFKVYELEHQSVQATDFQYKVNELEALTEQLKNHNAQLDKQGEEREIAIESLENKVQDKEALETQVKQLEHHNAELVKQKKSLKEAADKFQSELEMREKEYQKHLKEKDSMKEILQSKVNELEQLSAQATSFQSKVNELEEQTDQLTNHNAELVQQGEERKMAIENLENKVQSKEAIEDQVKQLEHHITKLVEERESLKVAAHKYQSEHEMRENDYLKEVKEKDSIKEILESKVKELEQQSTQIRCHNETILQDKENIIMELKIIRQNCDDDHVKEMEELKVAHEQSKKKIEAKHAEQRAQMREKLQSRLKEAGNIMQTKYNEKLEQYAAEKDQEVSEIRNSESKFSKMADELQKKYNASKAIVTDKMVENKKLKSEVEQLRKKLGRQEQPNKHTSMSPPPPSNDVFKAPKNTPGRSKPGRTQSDIQIKAPSRRPPMGTGNLFTMDDEQGEMFSSSYLSELKSGKCSMDNSGMMFCIYFETVETFYNLYIFKGRISELARRNSMMPAHLQSSYPAETQYYKSNLFSDDELRKGSVKEITDKTANLTFDSPAANTRTQRKRRSGKVILLYSELMEYTKSQYKKEGQPVIKNQSQFMIFPQNLFLS